ncbi:AbfB domain-containing protein [Lentzea flaviverrucosa]|uniref:Glycosyl hydrolases family 2 n=1 Tax=Lentzea flaviverrucosa TaxID=200379 RepID=A0A1H9JMG6_9PSEU|nr:AbfB domain-containing protein [Lentzea flaviverrucosa]RDI26565.1 glycosyl hydrolase family 2 [Lentzea flaviverrucosa]SEQ87989.1 Glycosyl hydrolases family 2 [Lentzea flaviverrucosa]
MTRRVLGVMVSILITATFLTPTAHAAEWVPKVPPLSTPWTSQVSPANALPEYPRPQLQRPEWQNLNGVWEFAGAPNLSNPPIGRPLAEGVLVPYPIESALSGIKRHEDNMFYRRTFTVPSSWNGRQVKLNFGAVTWETRVWVNGRQVGTHTGGFDAFSFDITSALAAGTNEIVVGVTSTVDGSRYPIGKQRRDPSGIFYTAASGIWQTVWLEPVRAANITRLDTTPNVGAGALDLVVQGTAGQPVTAEVLSGGQVVGRQTGTTGSSLRVPVPNARLWSPDDPFLYDLRVTLAGGDAVTGYFGMRSLGKAMVGGVMRPLLNGKFVFQSGTLDQGYWPDGIYTAPTDEALRFDLERQKALGFNMVRKHIKVEPARWFYHADRLGLMVWQDMPSVDSIDEAPNSHANFESELRRMIDQLKGITSIVQWVPFNEGWGEYDAGRIVNLVRSIDNTRLINHNSGSNCCVSDPDPGNGDVIDDHHYQISANTRLPDSNRVAMLGEFGGLGRRVAGHEYQPGAGFAYGALYPDEQSLTKRYEEVIKQVQRLVHTRGLSAMVYTEPYDVENEVNGFYTYDRRVLKMTESRVRDVNQRVLAVARGTAVSPDDVVSLRVTTTGYTNRYLRHQDSLARTDVISTDLARLDATFHPRPGLADAACLSFESRNFPGQFLRHSNGRIRTDVNNGTIAADATFCAREGSGGTALESFNVRGSFVRHFNEGVYLARSGGPNPWDTASSFAADSTWAIGTGLWRSGADLPLDQARSFRVTSPGFTDRYLRHREGLARTDVVNASSAALLKSDATFVVRRGLADPTCYSFEARNISGQFLRHADFRVRLGANDNTDLFRRDATFCAQQGSGGVRLESVNELGTNIRHYQEEVWVASNGGAHVYDNPASYNQDVSWAVSSPWAP